MIERVLILVGEAFGLGVVAGFGMAIDASLLILLGVIACADGAILMARSGPPFEARNGSQDSWPERPPISTPSA